MVKILKDFRRSMIERMSDQTYIPLANRVNALKGHKHRIGIKENGKIMSVSDGRDEIYICRRNRLWLYKHGIANRIERLSMAYLLHRLPDDLHGAFVDCGANVGELGLYSRARGLEYHAFEPETLEADCCDLNNFSGERKTNRFGLWSHDGELTFYSKPSTGDSSLFETEDHVATSKIPVRSLDSVASEKGLKKIAVLKIEAEGAEPEILHGSTETLKATRFVTVDCGFERGISKESTLVPVLNIMASAGFEIVDWNIGRVSCLFRNRRT